MFRFSIAVLFVLSLLSASAQINYEFTHFEEEYNDLLAPIPLHGNAIWDDPGWIVPMGFEFQYNGIYYTHLQFRGLNSYGGELVIFNPGFDELAFDFIFPFAQDIRDLNLFDGERPLSPVSFQSTGAIGNRLFKLQWDDAGFYGDATSTMKIDIQLWLYELGGVIEFRYGERENIIAENVQTWNGMFCGLGLGLDFENENAVNSLLYLSGDPASPEALITSDTNEEEIGLLSMLNDVPANGQVYRFDNPLQLKETHQAPLSVYYDQLNRTLHFLGDSQVSECVVYSAEGKTIALTTNCKNNQLILPADLPSGVYIVQFDNGNGRQSERWTKSH